MLNQPTLDKLETLRLHGMAEAFRAQADPAQRDGLATLSFEERFGLLVDQEWTWRQNRALARRLTHAKFRYRASVEDIDFRAPRGLDRSLVRSLAQNSAWVAEHQNIFLLSPRGVGKSWLACALAEKTCRDFLEICEDRYQMRSTILTSQLPVAKWHERIGDPTLADSILDRLVHNAHRIELHGECIRKKLGGKQT